MRLVAKTDIAADAHALYGAMSDVAWLESIARRAGVALERRDGGAGLQVGAKWRGRFSYRGRERQIETRIETVVPGRLISAQSESGGFAILVEPSLTQLTPQMTRLGLVVEIKPNTFAARVLIQTLKLARGRLQARLDRRVETLARALKERIDARSAR